MTPAHRHHIRRRRRLQTAALVVVAVLSLTGIAAQQPRRPVPMIPATDRHSPGKIFLEHADLLELDPERGPDYQLLKGNVLFRKGDMFMSCDSAYFYEATGSLDAFGNIKMEQGDTLFVYGDELYFDGTTDLAHLYANPGKKVRLINRDVTLTTHNFEYDLGINVGYYDGGGELTDRINTLTSRQGYYYPDTKDAFFYSRVRLTGPRENGDTIRLYTDSLQYNTGSGIATLLTRTRIINRDGEILSSDGNYDTNTGEADLYRRSQVRMRRGNTLTADTLYYDRNTGIAHAYGSMLLTDSARQSAIRGNYGYYNELLDSAFVTGRAVALEYSRPDTLYLHGDTINAYRLPDSSAVTNVWHRVRFYRRDVQGLADSMSIREADSTLYMYRHPVLWSGERQVHGNEVRVHFNDSAVDRAYLPRFGMMTEHIAEDCYNQLAGTQMTAWIADTTITRLYVEGNVQAVFFPQEADSTYNKYAFVESSYLDAYFRDNDIERMHMWPETTGNVTPLYLARRSQYFLPSFQWYDVMRPRTPDDIFVRPPEMELLMTLPDTGARQPRQ